MSDNDGFNAGVVPLNLSSSQVNKRIASHVFHFYRGSNFVYVRAANTVAAAASKIEAKMIVICELFSPWCVLPQFQCFFYDLNNSVKCWFDSIQTIHIYHVVLRMQAG